MKKTRSIILMLIIALFTTTTVNVASIQLSQTVTIEPNKELTDMPNVILLIGDGMSPEQIRAASLIEYGKEFTSIMDTDFPIQELYTTNSISDVTTDSAASGTAMATGQLTENRYVSIGPDRKTFYKTILEYLQYDFGYSTGIVTSMVSTHATPAVFAAHQYPRGDFEAIRQQMLSKDVDIILGGGLDGPYLGPDIEAADDKGSIYGYNVAVNVNEMKNLAQTSDKLLGVFAGGEGDHIGYELERDIEKSPSLLEMTETALQFLEMKNKPYFVMIEGGLIDYAGHLAYTVENKTQYQIMETIIFEKSVRYALNVAKEDGNTIVVVAADHETGGFKIHDFSDLDNTLPSSEYTRDQNNLIRISRIKDLNSSFTSNAHSQTPVKFFGYGSDFGNYEILRNTDVFWAINKALGSFPTVLNQSYTPILDSLEVKMGIKDLDQTAQKIGIIISYNNNTDIEHNFNLNYKIESSYTFTIQVDTSQSYSAYIKVYDGGVNDIFSFDNQNQLIKQGVLHRVSAISNSISSDISSDSSTPSPISSMASAITTEKSDEDDSPIYQSFLALLFILIIFSRSLNHKIKKKQNRSN